MPYSTKAKDPRDGIARLDDPGSPEKCCCVHATCCAETGHDPGRCKNTPGITIWKGRPEWFCLACREYQYGGMKASDRPRTS